MTLAIDDFESRDFAGGSGWAGPWTKAGDVRMRVNKNKPTLLANALKQLLDKK